MSTNDKTIILDFDSTLINCETLDVLAEVIYADSKNYQQILSEISNITKACMNGEMDLYEALQKRINLLNINKEHIEQATNYIAKEITSSFANNKSFLQKHAQDIFIFSGGFLEFILPIAKEFSIPTENIFANQFVFDNNNVVGLINESLMAHNMGKAKQLEALQRTGAVYVIGDGVTDAEIKSVGPQVKFYLFAENILRHNLKPKADKVIFSFDEFILDQDLR